MGSWMVFLLTAIYHMYFGAIYVPSKAWNGLGIWLVLITIVVQIVSIVRLRRRDKLKPFAKIGGFSKTLFYVSAPFLVPFLLCIMIIHGPGSIITSAFGHPYNHVIVVADKSEAKRDSDCGYEIESPQLKRAAMKELCIKEEQFERLPQSGVVAVSGKQSWFGRTITRYGVPPADHKLRDVVRARKKIYSEWEVRDPEEVEREREARRARRKAAKNSQP